MIEPNQQLVPTLKPEIVTLCTNCKSEIRDTSSFCQACGTATSSVGLVKSHETMVAYMSQAFGLHPFVTFATLAVDNMLFGQEALTLGVGWLISVPVALALGVGTAFCQRHMFEDKWGAAFGKSVLITVLTAIPTSLPAFLLIPQGVLGLTKTLKQYRKKG